MDTATITRNYFASLGLSSDIADIYYALHRYGPQTVSELARSSGVERTKIYRLHETLQQNNLVEISSDYHRGIYRAAPLTNLEILFAQKEQQLQTMQAGLPLLIQALQTGAAETVDTKVQFYRGSEGVRQMLWNETKATSEVCGILYEKIQLRTKSKFFERWAERCNERELQFRGIVSDSFLASEDVWYNGEATKRLEHWQGRYVSPDVFPITHNTIMYDDVVAHFSWSESEIFGIEIHNPQIAGSQRALFGLLWDKAEPIPSA